MVTRLGHVSLRVPDLGAAVAFVQGTLGLREVERRDGRAYLTCNERHHELILADGAGRKAVYEHVGLEVADAAALEETVRRAESAGGRRLRDITDEPGIEHAILVGGPGGHVFKLFYGMDTSQARDYPADGVRAVRCEHISLNVRRLAPMERFLREGLGFAFSDRIGRQGAWFHCEGIHHGIALVRTPKNGLAHYAFALESFDDFRRIGDHLLTQGRSLTWGPGRHGPGNNLFIYFFDAAGVMIECCAEMALVGAGHPYQPRRWALRPSNINLWGGFPPPRFLLANTRRALQG